MKWPEIPFSKLAEIVTGNTPSKKNPENYGPGVPWVKPPDLDKWEAVIVTAETLSPKGQKISRLLPEGTVMVSCIGSIGRVGIAGATIATNQQINSLIFSSIIEPRFGYYYCKSITQKFQSLASKAVVPILNKTNFSKIKMPLPPISEQVRIVEILDQADRLRKLRAYADAKAQRILPALFIKMFGDPATNPMGWPVKKMGSIAIDLRYGTSIKCSSEEIGLPVLRIPNVVKGGIELNDIKFGEPTKNEIDSLMLKQGDILFVRTNGNRDYVGRCAVFDLDGNYLYASYLIRARLFKEKVDPKFVVSYLSTPTGRQAMAPFIRTTAGQSNISQEGLKQIPIPLPPIEKQKMFCRKVEESKKLIKLEFKRFEKIKLLFTILLHRAFTGDLTASWREAHMKELLQEMERQSSYLEQKK